ncbi:MAG: RluA family pseudouridine synthase [Treponema sp.]|nr:RluA family pseudouridine synthase [Treponema sp.]
MNILSLIVDETITEPMRLDLYVAQAKGGMSRSRLKSTAQIITLNGKNAKLSKNVHVGDKIEIKWENPKPENLEPEDIPLDIIFENSRVTVVNKNHGIVVHPAAGNWSGTLVNALLFHWGKSAQILDEKENSLLLRPGIVHRLDKDTSGVLITARDRDALTWLQNQFQTRRVKKEYIAIVTGRPKEIQGSIKTGIIRDSRNRKKFATTDIDKGKFAHTIYKCIACYGPYSLIRIKLKTGRTHQIRVHMKYLGCPVLGDSIYGKKDILFENDCLMLHARRLGIRLPESNEFSIFEAPVPQRFKKVLKTLHEKFKKETL